MMVVEIFLVVFVNEYRIYMDLWHLRFYGFTFFIYVSGGAMKKRPGNPKWGGARLESKLIEKHADQWCKDNGYPLIKRKYVYKGKWKLVDIQR